MKIYDRQDVVCPTCGGLARGLFEDKTRLRSYYWLLARRARDVLTAWHHMDTAQQQHNSIEMYAAVHELREFFTAHPRR